MTNSDPVTSGLRFGTPAATTRGFKETEFKQIVDIIHMVLSNTEDQTNLTKAKQMVEDMCSKFPLYNSI